MAACTPSTAHTRRAPTSSSDHFASRSSEHDSPSPPPEEGAERGERFDDHDTDDLARPNCFGAAALANHCPRTRSGPLTPPADKAVHDLSVAYRHTGPHGASCFGNPPTFTLRVCHFGALTSPVNVAYVGNSHAGMWLPAVQAVAGRHGWRVTTFFASRCVFAETLQTIGGQACLHWTKRVEQRVLRGHFDLIVLLDSLNVQAVGAPFSQRFPLYQTGYETILRKLKAIHARVVGVRDNPIPHKSLPDCLVAHPADYLACAGPRRLWVNPEPLFSAMDRLHDPRFVKADLTNYFCRRLRCDAAVGGVPVYKDNTHPTATYARTLAPYLEPFLVRGLTTA
jgi:hypothetical protein